MGLTQSDMERRYEFNDRSVTPVNAADIVTASAYVLFYQLREPGQPDPASSGGAGGVGGAVDDDDSDITAGGLAEPVVSTGPPTVVSSSVLAPSPTDNSDRLSG